MVIAQNPRRPPPARRKKIKKPMATEFSVLNKSVPSIFDNCLDSVVEFCMYFCVIIRTFLYTFGYHNKNQLKLLVGWL